MNITIRITRTTITFTAPNTVIEGQTDFEQYNMKSGISVAANLRQAIAECNILRSHAAGQGAASLPPLPHPVFDTATVFVDTPLLLIPSEEYDAAVMPQLYHYANTQYRNDNVEGTPVPQLNVVAAYAVGKDLKFVLTETFRTVKFMPLLAPILVEFGRRSYGGFQEKLFCYFHDKRVDVCAFRKSRVRFCSSFDATNADDAVYFILNTWQQLGMRPSDVICLSGNITGHEALLKLLKQFVKNVKHVSI